MEDEKFWQNIKDVTGLEEGKLREYLLTREQMWRKQLADAQNNDFRRYSVVFAIMSVLSLIGIITLLELADAYFAGLN